eukprot:1394134-Prymnesium_polylepis.1
MEQGTAREPHSHTHTHTHGMEGPVRSQTTLKTIVAHCPVRARRGGITQSDITQGDSTVAR